MLGLGLTSTTPGGIRTPNLWLRRRLPRGRGDRRNILVRSNITLQSGSLSRVRGGQPRARKTRGKTASGRDCVRSVRKDLRRAATSGIMFAMLSGRTLLLTASGRRRPKTEGRRRLFSLDDSLFSVLVRVPHEPGRLPGPTRPRPPCARPGRPGPAWSRRTAGAWPATGAG